MHLLCALFCRYFTCHFILPFSICTFFGSPCRFVCFYFSSFPSSSSYTVHYLFLVSHYLCFGARMMFTHSTKMGVNSRTRNTLFFDFHFPLFHTSFVFAFFRFCVNVFKHNFLISNFSVLSALEKLRIFTTKRNEMTRGTPLNSCLAK